MHNQSDYGYSTGAVSMTCIACGSDEMNCCDGTMPAPAYRLHKGLVWRLTSRGYVTADPVEDRDARFILQNALGAEPR